MLLSQFAEYKRNFSDAGNYKDFRHRPNRKVGKLKSLGVYMGDDVISHKAIPALRSTDRKFPIAISPLKTSGDASLVRALEDLTIKMRETHLPIADHAGVYQLSQDPGEESSELYDVETEWGWRMGVAESPR